MEDYDLAFVFLVVPIGITISGIFMVYFRNTCWKEYLDNPIHRSPVNISTIESTLIIGNPKGVESKNTVTTHNFSEKLLIKLVKSGVLKGDYDEVKKVYTSPYIKIYERKMLSRGYVKYKNEWITLEKRKKIAEERKRKKDEHRRQVEERERKELELGLSNNFADYDPYEFEDKIAELFRKMGYEAKTTTYSRDFGADVIAEDDKEKIVIQVKRYSYGNNVTPTDVLKTVGAIDYYGADRAIVITTSSYSYAARDIGKKSNIMELWDGDRLKSQFRRYYIDEMKASEHDENDESEQQIVYKCLECGLIMPNDTDECLVCGAIFEDVTN